MRIRTIKPEFFLHEGLFEAERATKLPLRIAFAGLWCAADREGRFKWEPRKLGIQILPYDQVDFAAVLNALESCGALMRYGDNLEFGCVPNFSKHQCVNVRESQSQIPPPPETTHESTVHARAGIERTPNGVNIPVSLRETVFARDGRKCLRCGNESDLTVDHIFPQCMGGTHVLSNLRTLCRPCNSKRPVAGEAFIADLAVDGLTPDDMKVLCMHVHARGEGKGKEQGREGDGENSPDKKQKENKSRCTLEQAKAFAKELSLPESDGESCFHKWEGNGWKNGDNPIKDWKATIRSWKAAGYLPSQKQPRFPQFEQKRTPTSCL